ncbi:hypothetical protein J3458_000411 [Metarhizium acridum]|uniref:uncharacterized protein n=1 Tax=Metarhizium acridum TaxID=92637 RepID=UPI001C6B3174|nr:hypothetical protein J3458_000411 [Metarhizium acridum]
MSKRHHHHQLRPARRLTVGSGRAWPLLLHPRDLGNCAAKFKETTSGQALYIIMRVWSDAAIVTNAKVSFILVVTHKAMSRCRLVCATSVAPLPSHALIWF